MKEIFGAIATVLTFTAYIPYFRDIYHKKTHPHLYTWMLWFLLTVLIVVFQIIGGAGPAVWVTVAAGLMSLVVIILGYRHSDRDITNIDKLMAMLGLLAIVVWVFAKDPVLSLVLVVIADTVAFVPTIRKSWSKPYTETLSLYITNVVRFSLALFAVDNFTFLATFWIIAWIVLNGLFSTIIVVRRRVIQPA